MSLSNIVEGKANSIAAGVGEVERGATRPAHAPMFARPGEPEPNAVSGERLQPASLRGKPVPVFEGRDANAQGMPQHPGALGWGSADATQEDLTPAD